MPPSDESRIQDYLAGRLDAAEAERFEERMFADDGLAAEVQRALEIRASTSLAAAKARRGPPRRAWMAFAAAAGVAALGVGVAWLQPADPPVFRGAEQRMGLEVQAVGTTLRARWQPVAGTAGYELQVLARDGRVLRSMETDDTAAVLALGDPGPDETSEPAFVEVSALDGVGQTLRRSERVAIPNR